LGRALGYRLARPEKLLNQFLDHLDRAGASRVSVAGALDWARLPAQRRLELVGLSAGGGTRDLPRRRRDRRVAAAEPMRPRHADGPGS
jgi:hypothetical protein